MSERIVEEKVMDIIVNTKDNVTYRRENFLGEGAFASCYEFRNVKTNEVFAGKVVSKNKLTKPRHKERVLQEIDIQGSLSYKYVVSLHSYFEDDSNMYMILELCRKRSLKEMLTRRKTLTVLEVQYFMRQIVLACKYMHCNKVVHRDLKLGNIFINDNMEIKIGDFGLATRIKDSKERKNTLCGTPNYTAPEVLTKSGHNFKADMWSLGCIMYALLVGSPPFDTETFGDTYSKIKNCDYYLPPKLDRNAKDLIKKLLNPNPDKRPNANAVLCHDFLTMAYIPSRLPTSYLTMKPRFLRTAPLRSIKNSKLLTTRR